MVSYSFQGNKRLWTTRDEEENDRIFSQQSQPTTGVEIPLELHPLHLVPIDPSADKWPVSQIMRLLRFYAAHRCLYDVQCEDNHIRKMRQAALIDITAAMGGDLTKDQVVQKINVIRATYRYEKKRIKQRMRRGLGARTKLKWFALADAFLRGVPKKGHKKEDPHNSDSDLEDAIVFTINPEALGPLEPHCPIEELQECTQNSEFLVEPKTETFADDSQVFVVNTWAGDKANDSSSSDDSPLLAALKEPKLEDVEDDLQEQLKNYKQTLKTVKEYKINGNNSEEFKMFLEENEEINTAPKDLGLASNETSPKSWTLATSLEFIQLLKAYPVLFETAILEYNEASANLALQDIAKAMQKPLKSIEKRWHVFTKTYKEEKQKMLENPQYQQPPYKWWNEAVKLMEPPSVELKTESIYLEEKEGCQTSSDVYQDEGYENLFQNPIPSVAPMSNMNEAMASLFHEDFSQGSNTNSSFPVGTESSQSCKIIWNGLEDDLLEGKWSLKHSVKFLRLYGAHRCLWDLHDPDYRSRPLRNAAIEDIAASMGHDLTASYVAKKIKIFRITYMQQRKRILEATQRGETPDILLKWFPLADSFLRPHIGLRSIKADAKEMPQFDFQYVYANLNLIDPALLTDFRGKGTQNAIDIGNDNDQSMNSEAEEG